MVNKTIATEGTEAQKNAFRKISINNIVSSLIGQNCVSVLSVAKKILFFKP
jgi:hypothetical protein